MAQNDLQCIYKTSADMMKHFNSLLDKVRIIVVTTGLMVFASAGTMYLEKDHLWLPLLISFWGTLLIISMWILAHHYIRHTKDIAEGARDAEEILLKENNAEIGAFHKIHKGHEKKKQIVKCIITFFHDYSTFILMLIGCIMIFSFFSYKIIEYNKALQPTANAAAEFSRYASMSNEFEIE